MMVELELHDVSAPRKLDEPRRYAAHWVNPGHVIRAGAVDDSTSVILMTPAKTWWVRMPLPALIAKLNGGSSP